MENRHTIHDFKFSRDLLSLIAILLAAAIMMLFIWLWYDIKITRLDKEQNNSTKTTTLPTNQ